MEVVEVCVLIVFAIPLIVMLWIRKRQEADPAAPGLALAEEEHYGWKGLTFGAITPHQD